MSRTPRDRQANPADLIDRLFEPAEGCRGLGQLERMVDRIAQTERV